MQRQSRCDAQEQIRSDQISCLVILNNQHHVMHLLLPPPLSLPSLPPNLCFLPFTLLLSHPHSPSLSPISKQDIADGSLNLMMNVYRDVLGDIGGYLTDKVSRPLYCAESSCGRAILPFFSRICYGPSRTVSLSLSDLSL